MLKTFLYRLFPTKSQKRFLTSQLEECRWLYNHLLQERIVTYKGTGSGVGYLQQQNRLPALKVARPSLSNVHSQVLQNVAIRIDLAFKAFFRRVKTGGEPGFPRFRGQGRYDSMTFPQAPSGCRLKNGFLRLAKVGAIRIVLHRKMEGKPRTCTIKCSSTGKWFASFVCECSQQHLPTCTEQVGIDVGLYSFATLSTGETIDNPRFYRKEEKKLAIAQRRLSRTAKGTTRHTKQRKSVSRIYERITFRRKDFCHKIARGLVQRFGVLAVEDLEINRMVRNVRLAKSISDAAWSRFFTFLTYKAAWAGRTIVKVNPAYTSQTCSDCGHRQKMPLQDRIYRCPHCGLILDRDHNAALNILSIGLGQQSMGPIPNSSLPQG